MSKIWRRILATAVVLVSSSAVGVEVESAGQYQPHTEMVSSSGNLIHSLPIDMPAGIDGFQPKLELAYQSGATNGVMGLGWQIGGLSSIHRCPKTLAQDGLVGGVSYTSSDRLCLDGNRILVPVSGATQAERDVNYHGFIGATPALNGSDAHLELDGFVKLARVNGQSGVRVQRRDGTIAYYGNWDGAHSTACAVALMGSSCGEYLVSRVDNPKTGDYIEYFYTTPAGKNKHYLSRVEYAHAGARKAVVSFVYDSRTDVRSYFIGGKEFIVDLRLKNISSYYVSSAASFDAHVYDIAYFAENKSSVSIDNIKHCRTVVDAAGVEVVGTERVCLPAVKYSYEATTKGSYQQKNTTGSAFQPTNLATPPFGVPSGSRTYDIDGDGDLDYVFGGAYYSFINCAQVKSEYTYANGLAYSPVVLINNGGAYERSATIENRLISKGIYFFRYYSDCNGGVSFDSMDVADFNGDGYNDLIESYNFARAGHTSSNVQQIWLYSPSDRYYTTTGAPDTGAFSAYRNNYNGKRQAVFYLDINGDKKADVLALYKTDGTNVQKVFLQTSSGFSYSSGYTDSISGYSNLLASEWTGTTLKSYGVRPVDVNGDGLPDLVQAYSDGGTTARRILINDPNGLNGPQFKSTGPYSDTASTDLGGVYLASYDAATLLPGSVRFIDLNGDGLLDILGESRVKGSSYAVKRVRINTGAGFKDGAGFETSFASGIYSATNDPNKLVYAQDLVKTLQSLLRNPSQFDNENGYFFLDVTGDGLPDQVKLTATGTNQTIGVSAEIRENTGSGFSGQLISASGSTTCASSFTATRVPYLLDMGGDGQPDIFIGGCNGNINNFPAPYSVVLNAKYGRAGLIRRVNDSAAPVDVSYKVGLPASGNTSTGNYVSGIDASRALTTTESIDNMRHFSSRLVVGSLARASGTVNQANQAESVATSYGYDLPVMNKKGRGFVGYETTKSITTQSPAVANSKQITVSQKQRLEFPYIGLPVERKTLVQGKSQVTETYVLNNKTRGLSVFPYVESRAATYYDPLSPANSAEVLYSESQAFGYDGFGNLTLDDKATTQTVDGKVLQRRALTEQSYYAEQLNGSQWLPSLLQFRKVTQQLTTDAALDSEFKRRDGYNYDAAGRLAAYLIEPAVNASDAPLLDGAGKLTAGSNIYSQVTSYERESAAPWLVSGTQLTAGAPATHRGQSLATVIQRKTAFVYESGKRFVTHTKQFRDTGAGAIANNLLVEEAFDFDELLGLARSHKNAAGFTSSLDYDAWGRVISGQSPGVSIVNTNYESCLVGEGCKYKKVVTQVGYPSTEQRFDALGRKVAERAQVFSAAPSASGEWSSKTYEYDVYGRLIKESRPSTGAPALFTSYGYDALDRLIQQTNPDQRVIKSSFDRTITSVTDSGAVQGDVAGDACSPTFNTVDSSLVVRRETRTATGWLMRLKDACGADTTYAYDAAGNRAKAVDALGNEHAWSYDSYGYKRLEKSPDQVRMADGYSAEYRYDALGNMILSMTSAQRLNTLGDKIGTLYEYDDLGRLTKESGEDLVSNWQYDLTPTGWGRLGKALAGNHYLRTHDYDSVTGLPNTTTTTVDGSDYTIGTGYDSLGRVETVTYPGNVGYKNVYSEETGHLKSVTSLDGVQTFWQALGVDLEGRVNQEKLGDSVQATRAYVPETGLLKSAQATGAQGALLQDNDYIYDNAGNVKQRQDGHSGVVEQFSYDSLNRLLVQDVYGGPTVYLSYDVLGNIKSKSDVGAFVYPASGASSLRPHAVSSVAGLTYSYDENGNTTAGNGRSYTWTHFNKPATITKSPSNTIETFTYDAEHERVKRQVKVAGGDPSTFIYLNPRLDLGGTYEKETKANGSVEQTYHLYANGRPIGALVKVGAAAPTPRYFLADQLGSITATVDASGVPLEHLAYDAWGARRDLSFTTAPVINGSLAGMLVPGGADDPDDLVRREANGSISVHTNNVIKTWPLARGVDVPADRTHAAELVMVTGAQYSSKRNFLFAVENSATAGSGDYRRFGIVQKGTQLLRQKCVGNAACEEVLLTTLSDSTEYTFRINTTGQLASISFRQGGGSEQAESVDVDWRGAVPGMQKRVVTGLGSQQRRLFLPLGGVMLPLRRFDSPVMVTALTQETVTAQENAISASTTRHGFTGHEMLDDVALVHMNGRVYDPQIGRFLSHDPVLAYPEESQDYNRYSYVWNGPLNKIDPEGQCVGPFVVPCAMAAESAVTSTYVAGTLFAARYGPTIVNLIEGYFNPGSIGGFVESRLAAGVREANALLRAESVAKGLATGADEAVFWSGIGRRGAEFAAAWVGRNGGATLESTLASRGISLPVWDASNPAVVSAWRQASIEFAAGAKGNIRVLQGGDVMRINPNPIWADEYKALISNPNVSSITAINPGAGTEVLLWAR